MHNILSIIIPLFNEQENIDSLYDRLYKAAEGWDMKMEIILVDDGSWDNTLEYLKEKRASDSRVKIVKLSRNFGHQCAITAGLRYTNGDVVAIMDGDLQDPPEYLQKFIDKWREGYHVVYAIRKNRKEGILKKFAYKLFYRILRFLSDIEIPIDSGDFCLMDRKVVYVLNQQITEKNRFVRGLRAYAGFNQIGITYDRNERMAGEAKYNFTKLINLALDGIFDFSTFPLRLSTYLGIVISFVSFLSGCFMIFHRIINFKLLGFSPTDTPGLATLGVGIFFLSGIILIILGIIGEYIGRMYLEVKNRPFYIVDELYLENEC